MEKIVAYVHDAEPKLYSPNLALEGLPDLPVKLEKFISSDDKVFWMISRKDYPNWQRREAVKEKFNKWLRSLAKYGIEVSLPEDRQREWKKFKAELDRKFPEGRYVVDSLAGIDDRASYAWGHRGEVEVKDGVVRGIIKTAGEHPNNLDYAGKIFWQGECPLEEFFEICGSKYLFKVK